jgi:DNA adenine methylase
VHYPGGKGKVARPISEVMLGHIELPSRRTYIEPFLGAASVFERMAPSFDRALGSDLSVDLVLLWQALAAGWQPPHSVTREEYKAARHGLPPSALRTFIGFGCSWGGKWWGGPARCELRSIEDYADAAARSLVGMQAVLARPGVEVVCAPYTAWDWAMGPDVVVYADPPYAGTTAGYAVKDAFDTDAFWATCLLWTRAGAQVFVSEESIPAWVPAREVWSREQSKSMQGGTGTRAKRVERLYVVGG